MRLCGVVLFGLGCVGLWGCVSLEEPAVEPGPNWGGLRAQAAQPRRHYPLDDRLRLNHIQLKATHNSYHQRPGLLFAPGHDYSHPPLEVQLERHGVRGFELDVHAADSGELEVYHLGALDSRTSCRTLRACLGAMRRWSDRRRHHVPLVVWIEIKRPWLGRGLRDLTAVDAVIRDVFEQERLITPDAVQADYPSPRARVSAEGWPTLAETRGRVLFVLLNRDLARAYTGGYRSLAGRAMFAVASPAQYEQPWALVTKYDDPREGPAIRRALDAGLLVATNTCGAGHDDGECAQRLQAALQNGPQTLHDDFSHSVRSRSYWLNVPGATPARCNPITAPAECTSDALE